LNNARGWLGQVMRNLARQDARSESRRQHREQVVAGRQVAPSTSELAEKAAMQRELVGDVLALEEPLRGIVLLRFFEDLRPKEIAQRLGIPVKTVHSRLARAMEQLRLRLDARYGDRSNWGALLLPLMPRGFEGLATPGKTFAAASTTGFVWFVGLFVAVAASLIVAWQFHLLPGQMDETEFAGVGGDANESSALGVEESGLAGPMPSGRSDEVLVTPEAAQRAADEGSGQEASGVTERESRGGGEGPTWVLKGQVVDMDGNGVPLAQLQPFRSLTEPLTIADASGRFSSVIKGSKRDIEPSLWHVSVFALEVQSDEWATVRSGQVPPRTFGEEHLVLVARKGSVRGRVVDERGLGIVGASVSIEHSLDMYRGFPHDLTRTASVSYVTQTKDNGEFLLGDCPMDPRIGLKVGARGFGEKSFSLAGLESPVEFQLRRLERRIELLTLTGIVLSSTGRPVPEVTVRFARTTTTTDRDGRFGMTPPKVAAPDVDSFGLKKHTPLLAFTEGITPASKPDFGRDWLLAEGAPMFVELRMGGEPSVMRGQVLNEEGNPCEGWSVKLVDETLVADGWSTDVPSMEDAVRGNRLSLMTDAEGRFEVGGLLPREYCVRVIDPVSLQRVTQQAHGGDQDVVISIPTNLLKPLSGQVLNLDDEPLVGIGVQLITTTFESNVYGSIWVGMSGQLVHSDEEGRFEFPGVPGEFVFLDLHGEGLVSRKFELTGDRHETIRMHRRRAVRVDFGPSPRLRHSVQFLDADGEVLTLKSTLGNGFGSAIREKAGLSRLWLVSETACSLRVNWSKRGGGFEYGEPQPFRLEATGPTTLTL
ncbi:MAG: sigma-70 family RNA polymerase sigma factor, partial [bacterium]|nr:sigma-70 family RNA polymerase sigma factor [bacterium]